MRRTSRLLLIIALAGAVNAPIVHAATPVSVEFGYLNTSSDSYESGFVWGATIRGDQRITFGVGIRFYENSVKTLESDLNPGTFLAEDKYRLFSVSPYAYLDVFKGKPDNQILIGAGPQIHFVSATQSIFAARTSVGARETRLGFGGLMRYERRIRMFQELFFAAEVYYSYMEGTFEKAGNYQPPLESVNRVGVVMGLGYPL
jgi:hypothetical protein